MTDSEGRPSAASEHSSALKFQGCSLQHYLYRPKTSGVISLCSASATRLYQGGKVSLARSIGKTESVQLQLQLHKILEKITSCYKYGILSITPEFIVVWTLTRSDCA